MWERAYVVILEGNGAATCYGPFATLSLCNALIFGWYSQGRGDGRKASVYPVERP